MGQISHHPYHPSKFSFQAIAVPHRRNKSQHPPWNQRNFSGEKEIWRSLIQVPAQIRANFNIRSACSVKIWKSPKTMILQLVLAPVPVLIHPHYENVFLLCPTKYSGSPKLLHIQHQKCWVEGNNNLLWPAIYTLIIAARYAFSPPCCKGMLPHSFSTFVTGNLWSSSEILPSQQVLILQCCTEIISTGGRLYTYLGWTLWSSVIQFFHVLEGLWMAALLSSESATPLNLFFFLKLSISSVSPCMLLMIRCTLLSDCAKETENFRMLLLLSCPACEVPKSMIILMSWRGCKLNRHSWEKVGGKLRYEIWGCFDLLELIFHAVSVLRVEMCLLSIGKHGEHAIGCPTHCAMILSSLQISGGTCFSLPPFTWLFVPSKC